MYPALYVELSSNNVIYCLNNIEHKWPEYDASLLQKYLWTWVANAHLYTWVERRTLRVQCLA